jgi:1-acyl-sn-glycerol-3-phosphate acyltransferase
MPALKACMKAAFMVAQTLILMPFQLVALALSFDGPGALEMPRLWHKGVCRAFGIKVEVKGTPVTDRQVLYVGNHLSHLDINVLGGLLPVAFVAKADVRGWPVFGFLAVIQRTVFISRARGDAMLAKDSFEGALKRGRSLFLFPEGTSSAGETALPFKSSLFASVAGTKLMVQPFSVVLLEVDGRPVKTVEDRDVYAYHRDMTFAPHLWTFMKGRGARVRIVFHPPIDAAAVADRKELAAAAQAAVARGLS